MLTLKEYFQTKYKSRVYKITLDAGFTCPNRDGSKGLDGCIFCDPQGNGKGQFLKGLPLEEQIRESKAALRKRYKAEKFFLYFQAFSNTYGQVNNLKEIYDRGIAMDEGDIAGIIIGTRPDCVDEEKLKLISSYYPKYEVWVEYGLQTIHQKTLDLINRKHTVEDYIKAVALTKKFPIKITTHIIVGLPYETYNKIMETARFIVQQNKIDGIKIHSLFIPKGSKLEELYNKEKFKLMTMQEYVQTAVDVLEILPKELVVARITGEINHSQLIEPKWVLKKQAIIKAINDELNVRNALRI